jgi:putative acetyltransferase
VTQPPEIRPIREDDYAALAALYRETVEQLGPALYTPDQVTAWAAFADDLVSMREYLFVPRTLVAVDAAGPLGFCGIAADGHVMSLYVASRATRQGLGSRLLQAAMADARQAFGVTRYYTEASFFSRAVFERHGFVVDEEEVVIRNEVAFRRFKMSHTVPAVSGCAAPETPR